MAGTVFLAQRESESGFSLSTSRPMLCHGCSVLTDCVPDRSRIAMSSTTSSLSCRTVRISPISTPQWLISFPVVCPDNLPAATEYAKKLLGSDYRACETPVFKSLWLNQLHCQYVDREGEDAWTDFGGA